MHEKPREQTRDAWDICLININLISDRPRSSIKKQKAWSIASRRREQFLHTQVETEMIVSDDDTRSRCNDEMWERERNTDSKNDSILTH
jgi:hypothetical protein